MRTAAGRSPGCGVACLDPAKPDFSQLLCCLVRLVVLCGDSCCVAESFEGWWICPGSCTQWWGGGVVGEVRQAGRQEAVVHSGKERRGVQAPVGDGVSVSAGIRAIGRGRGVAAGRRSSRRGDLLGGDCPQVGGQCAEIFVGEAVGLELEHRQSGEQGVATLLAQAQAGDTPAGRGGDGWVMACRASAPVIGSWLIDWTRSWRGLAESRSPARGRLVSRLPIPKSRVEPLRPTRPHTDRLRPVVDRKRGLIHGQRAAGAKCSP